MGPITSDPAVVSWHAGRVDVLARSPAEMLGHTHFEYGWKDVETEIPMPLGTLSAVTRYRGSIDLFVTQPDGRIWHAFGPRSPR